MSQALIIDACRTPRGIGKLNKGSVSHLHPQLLGATVLRALKHRNTFATSDIDDVIWGTSCQKGRHSGDLGRMTALTAGYSMECGGVTLDRFCGSGITSVNVAAASIMSGMEDVIIAGGCEMMSSYGHDNGLPALFDNGNMHLRAIHPQSNQGVCADTIATLEGIRRQDLDSLAYESHMRAAHAINEKFFSPSIIPVVDQDNQLLLSVDELPRPQTTIDQLAKLNSAFNRIADNPLDEQATTYRKLIHQKYPDLQISPVHHAGNSSGVADGAAAILLCSEHYAKKRSMRPRARIRAFANAGDCPTLMLNAPVAATQKVLNKAGLSINDIDLFEVNEAFAVVVERYIRKLNVDRDKINVNGGAIALGHPIGATGVILINTLLDELERRDLKFGLATMCTAGGMAPAVIIERL